MTIADGRWALGIGDPTIIGWVTVIVYFIVAIICLKAFKSQSHTSINNHKNTNKTFWLTLSLMLIALGINKQLDLQSLLTQTGKDMAISQGWYQFRHYVQVGFIIFIGILGVSGLIIFISKFKHSNNSIKIAIAGSALLFTFILIRASSFHHIDFFINMSVAGVRMNWLLELSSLLIIGYGGIDNNIKHHN